MEGVDEALAYKPRNLHLSRQRPRRWAFPKRRAGGRPVAVCRRLEIREGDVLRRVSVKSDRQDRYKCKTSRISHSIASGRGTQASRLKKIRINQSSPARHPP